MTTGDVYRALWRYRVWIVLLTAVAAAATYAVVSRQTRIYEARSLIRVQQRINDPSQALTALATGQKLAETYADIVDTSTIAQSIADASYGRLTYPQLAGNIHGSPVQDLDLLWISARSPSPLIALRAANAAPAAIERFIHRSGTVHEHVITAQRATLPTAPVTPRVFHSVLLVLIAALVLNCGLALAVHTLRDPLGGAEQVHSATPLPLLGSIPKLPFEPAPRRRRTVATGTQLTERMELR